MMQEMASLADLTLPLFQSQLQIFITVKLHVKPWLKLIVLTSFQLLCHVLAYINKPPLQVCNDRE